MLEKKNILFVVNKLKRGGAEKAMLRQMRSIRAKGYNVLLAVLLDSISEDTYLSDFPDLKDGVFFCRMKGYFDFRGFGSFLELVKRKEISVLYSTLEFSNTIARLTKIFCPSLRVVIRESGMAFRKSLLEKLRDIKLNFLAYRVVAVSTAVMDSLLSYERLHQRKIVVIENGIDVLPKEVLYSRRKNNEKLNGEIKILHVGSMNNDNKGQSEILEVFDSLPEEMKRHVRLVCVGDGKLRPAIESQKTSLGSGDKINFTGNLKFEELEKEYLSADIYVLNSKNEGCPNTVLEAMSYGLPVIATKVGGAGEMVVEGETGILVDVGNRESLKKVLILLIGDETLRREMGSRGYDRVKENYSLEKQVQKTLEVLLK